MQIYIVASVADTAVGKGSVRHCETGGDLCTFHEDRRAKCVELEGHGQNGGV